ncbi:MAG: hypothetical protein NZ561_07195 [Phycisphaerae bacterium]|nr:hypothetical protein [Phycisphaerae bacterium]MDW8262966.1 hypothetical protein [Phycisphaerales bacterium]
MSRTIYRKIGSRRFSARPRRTLWLSLGSFDTLMARLDHASARLKASRRKSR